MALLTPARNDQRGLAPRRPKYTRTFYAYLPPAPTTPDAAAARAYWRATCQLLDKGGWTRGEWAGLRRLEKRWRRRVDGDDARWNVVGAKPGRLVSELESALKPPTDPSWDRPLAKGEIG